MHFIYLPKHIRAKKWTLLYIFLPNTFFKIATLKKFRDAYNFLMLLKIRKFYVPSRWAVPTLHVAFVIL